MLRGKFSAKRRGTGLRVPPQARVVVSKAITSVICESLERRRLLSTYSHTVTSGHTLVYLEPGEGAGSRKGIFRRRGETRLFGAQPACSLTYSRLRHLNKFCQIQ